MDNPHMAKNNPISKLKLDSYISACFNILKSGWIAFLFLTLGPVSLGADDFRFASFNVHGMQVKVSLRGDEDEVRDFPPGSGSNFLKIFSGLSYDVKSELWIGDCELTKKRSRGLELTAKEDASFLKFAVFVTDERLSESDLGTMKISALATAKDSNKMDLLNHQTLNRIKQAVGDVSTYDSRYMEAAKNIGTTFHLVSESRRHCIFSGQGPGFYTICSYIIAEGKMIFVIGWASLDGLVKAEERMSEIVELIESQTRKWDGNLPDLSSARFNGPGGLFSYKLNGRWEIAHLPPGASSLFPPAVKYAVLRNSDKTKADINPIIMLVVENTIRELSLDEYWVMSKKLMASKIKDGSFRNVVDVKPYQLGSGWSSLTTTFQEMSKGKINCRLVIIKTGPTQFLTATLMYDDTATDAQITSGMECINSIDTPNSSKTEL